MSTRVDELLAAMTLEERIGQITQVDRSVITPEEVAELAIGSVLSGGGGNPDPNTPAAWREMVDGYVEASGTSRLGVPILYGTDAVHGHSNLVGATIFPHNVALGASADPQLVEAVARATAVETAATGVRWTFAPMVAVPQDVRWGRSFECFGQDPELVAALGAAAVTGLQGAQPAIDVLACAKHFIADGGTTWGTTGGAQWSEWWARSYSLPGWQLDQGDARMDDATLRAAHLPPYRAAVASGVGTIMASYSSYNGTKMHAHGGLLTDVLKGELGFEGFVVSDYVAIDQVDPDYRTAVVSCLRAGVDMVMVPFDHVRFRETVRAAVEAGELPVDRLDDAVRRILTVKDAMGLLSGDASPLPEPSVIGNAEHRALARRAAAAGAVLLADDAGVLPIQPDTTVLVAGDATADIGLACGGWTIEWAGGRGAITPGSTLADGLEHHLGDRVVRVAAEDLQAHEHGGGRIGVVSVHEEPYAEGLGDRERLDLDPEQIDLVRRVAQVVDRVVLVVYSGRPLILDPVLDEVDAVVAAWWPGSEAAGIADVLVGAVPWSGRLPVDWVDGQAPHGSRDGATPRWTRGHGHVGAAAS